MLFLFCFSSYVKSQVTWEKYYSSGENFDCFGSDLCFSTLNNIYFVGSEGLKVIVAKVNQTGTPIWIKKYDILPGSPSGAKAVISTSNDGCIISGDCRNSFLLKINKDGEIEWIKFYSIDSYSSIVHLERTSNGDILGSGIYGGAAGYLMKTDSSGNLSWEKIIKVNYNKTYYSIIESFKQGYIAISNNESNGNNNQLEITEFDTIGAIMWSKLYSEGIAINIFKQDASYYLTGPGYDLTGKYIFTGRFDINGDKISSKRKYFKSNQYYLSSKQINSNKIFFSYFEYTGIIDDSTKYFISISDSMGNILHTKLIANYINANYQIKNVLTTSENDYVVMGTGRRISNPRKQMYAIKADSNLYFNPVGIVNYNTFKKDFQLSQNYPNPFNPSTIIEFSIPKNGIVAFKVYNSTGKEIYSSNKFFYTGTNLFEYSPENLSSGIYFYSLQFGENTQTRKMVFIK